MSAKLRFCQHLNIYRKEIIPLKNRTVFGKSSIGGYLALQDSNMDWNVYLSSYIKTYLERDVRELAAVQDLDAFRRFMVACAARTGQILNYANIAEEVGKDANTIKNWVSILEVLGIVYIRTFCK